MRVVAVAAVLCVATGACGATSPSTSPTNANEVRPPAAAEQPSLGPLGERLAPDVWVRSPTAADPRIEGRLTGLVPSGHVAVLRIGTVPASGPGGATTAVAAGVDPSAFRRFTPQGTAEVTQVWDAVARGEVAASYATAERMRLALGGTVTIAGLPVRVGAFADTGLPDLQLVMSDELAGRLGLPPANAVVLAGAGGDPRRLATAVHRAVGDGASVDVLREPVVQRAFMSGTAKRFGTLTYRVYPDRSVVVDPAWVKANIITQSVPIIGRMTCNRLMFPQLIGALNEIMAAGLDGTIHADQYEGCWWPKLIEDSNSLSMHAWGLAFDINVPNNQRLTHGDQDPRMVTIFKKWGFRWGGDWKQTPDPMHFELMALQE